MNGLSAHCEIDVCEGTIDRNFNDELKVILYNANQKQSFEVSQGDKIAKLFLHKISILDPIVVQKDFVN